MEPISPDIGSRPFSSDEFPVPVDRSLLSGSHEGILASFRLWDRYQAAKLYHNDASSTRAIPPGDPNLAGAAFKGGNCGIRNLQPRSACQHSIGSSPRNSL